MTISLYWYDHSGSENIREFFEKKGGRNLDSPNALLRIDATRALVFVHQSDETQWKNWQKLANSERKIVRMSTSRLTLGEPSGEHLHICEYRADALKDNRRVAQFFDQIEKENDWPSFSLLKLEIMPEYLIAAYLLLWAKSREAVSLPRLEWVRGSLDSKRLELELGSDFWRFASRERHNRGWELALPANWEQYHRYYDGSVAREAARNLRQKLANLRL